nr:hypothetical protein [uncultured Anaerosporobacter sp.]
MLEVRNNSDYECISCGCKKETKDISLSRKKVRNSNIVTFSLCQDCLRELAQEFKQFS